MLSCLLAVAIRVSAGAQAPSSPAWAYGFPPGEPARPAPGQNPAPAASTPPPVDASLKRIPGTERGPGFVFLQAREMLI